MPVPTEVFRSVNVIYAPGVSTKAGPYDALIVDLRLTDGGYVTVWANGVIQVSDAKQEHSVNYQVHTAQAVINLATIQPKPTEGE